MHKFREQPKVTGTLFFTEFQMNFTLTEFGTKISNYVHERHPIRDLI